MPQLYSKNRIMPHFVCPGSVGAEEDLDDLRDRSVIVVVRKSSHDIIPGALKPIAPAGRLIAGRLAP
jgi:hypothetical protein